MQLASAHDWPALLDAPKPSDHLVQLYRDEVFLCQAVTHYLGEGLRRGEGVIVIATPSHRAAFVSRLEEAGVQATEALAKGQLVLLDAEATLARFTAAGMPDWQTFHAVVGGAIADLRLEHPAVRAYGEMVDVLWQRGAREAALRLEQYWNDLANLQTFSLLCAYYMDALDPAAYEGPLECLCKVHTHLIPNADFGRLNAAVVEASEQVLDQPLAAMLLSLAERHRAPTAMPQGQATLLWLQRNMPRTAAKVLSEVRLRCSAA